MLLLIGTDPSRNQINSRFYCCLFVSIATRAVKYYKGNVKIRFYDREWERWRNACKSLALKKRTLKKHYKPVEDAKISRNKNYIIMCYKFVLQYFSRLITITFNESLNWRGFLISEQKNKSEFCFPLFSFKMCWNEGRHSAWIMYSPSFESKQLINEWPLNKHDKTFSNGCFNKRSNELTTTNQLRLCEKCSTTHASCDTRAMLLYHWLFEGNACEW